MNTPSWKRRAAAAAVYGATMLATTTFALPARAADASVATTSPSGSTTLVLNGTGARKGLTNYLYTARLYLEHKTTDPQAVLQNPGTTRFHMVMLRDTSAAEMADLVSQGLVANATEDDLVELVSEIFDIGVLLSQQGALSAGDSLEIDASPTAGTTLTLRGQAHGTRISQTFANPRLFKAMMGIWLGEHPADPALKQALLGQPI